MGILSTLVGVVVAAVGPVVALILVLGRARGRSRTLGVVGCLLLLLVDLGQAAYSALLPMILYRFHLPTSSAGLLFLPGTVFSAVGIILLGAAVAAAFRRGPASAPGSFGGPTDVTR